MLMVKNQVYGKTQSAQEKKSVSTPKFKFFYVIYHLIIFCLQSVSFRTKKVFF